MTTLSIGVLEDYARSPRTHQQSMKLRRAAPSPAAAQPAFAAFYEAYAEAILRYCRVRISNAAEAEDAAATVFARAFAAWPPADAAAERAWLFTIAHNTVANHYRSQSARPPARSIDEAFDVPAREASPHEIAVQREEQQTLQAAITQLTPDQQEVIQLRLAGLSGPEIADAKGRSPAAVKMLQFRAMQSLRTILRPDDGPSTDVASEKRARS